MLMSMLMLCMHTLCMLTLLMCTHAAQARILVHQF